MSIVENKIAFPTKLGKLMGLILLFAIPYLIENRLEKFGYSSLLIVASIWIPCFIMAAIYVYIWIKSDEKSPDGKEILKIMQEHNDILKEGNGIQARGNARWP
jgi:hypothetical protein